MAAAKSLEFVVRPLDLKTIEGALRVQLPPEALDQLGLKLGEICQITGSEDGLVKGYGLAWRATDRMGNAPKAKPAKMSDQLKTMLDLKDGSNVTISKAAIEIALADRIILRDVTPSEYDQVGDGGERSWRNRSIGVLAGCEALAVGMEFDVYVRKGLRRRFRIDGIDSKDNPQDSKAPPNLYFTEDATQFEISDRPTVPEAPLETIGDRPLITADRIGGLLTQLHTLNEHMSFVLEHARGLSSDLQIDSPINEAVLIHGYESTGKSLILKQLENSGIRNVQKISKSLFEGTVIAKNKALISTAFKAARAAQPSLVLLDDLDKLAPKGEDTYADILAQEVGLCANTQVLVIAACRSPNDINNSLLTPDAFTVLIELPIPDLQARSEILDVLLTGQTNCDAEMIRSLPGRTHGFTGGDLRRLGATARRSAFSRWNRGRNSLLNGKPDQIKHLDSSVSPPHGSSNNGDISNHQGNQTSSDDAPSFRIEQEDWEEALLQVRPTALREIIFEKPKIQWTDIGGSEAIKQRFDKIIGRHLHDAEAVQKLRLVPEKGVLLYGPPGCSKTLTAQAVASTYDLNFIAIQGAELLSMYVGESERAIREVFRKARAAAPCVVFFDEIDSIASEREASGTKGLNVLTTLLNEMDGFKALSNVLVLAATNKPGALDPAIMRPGRFGAHVYLGPPTAKARKEIFEISTHGLDLNEDVSFELLMDQTEGYTGAEIVQICTQAKEEAFDRYKASEFVSVDLRMEDFRRAIQQTKRGVTEEMVASYLAFAGQGV